MVFSRYFPHRAHRALRFGALALCVAACGPRSCRGQSGAVVDAGSDAEAPAALEQPWNIRNAAEACKAAPAEDPAARGYGLLAEGKREEALRALHDAVRPPGTLPVGENWIFDGFPPGYQEAKPGPQDYGLVSGGIDQPSYLFDRGVLVRRFRGRASFVPETSLIRVEHGPRIEVIRAATGEVVFEATSVDAIAERSGGLAVLHTDCAGHQKLDVLSGDAPRRMPTLDTSADKIAWVGDEYVWFRRENETTSSGSGFRPVRPIVPSASGKLLSSRRPSRPRTP